MQSAVALTYLFGALLAGAMIVRSPVHRSRPWVRNTSLGRPKGAIKAGASAPSDLAPGGCDELA
jgi:hypothetical protein